MCVAGKVSLSLLLRRFFQPCISRVITANNQCPFLAHILFQDDELGI